MHPQEMYPPSVSAPVSMENGRPKIIVGQDECVFAQWMLASKTCWIGPKGERPLLPKSEGDGYMLSAFVAREFGFGRQMTAEELAKVNEQRQGMGTTYIEMEAAMEILSTRKTLLPESPFVKYPFIGIKNEGYWNSYLMGLHFEDILVECLQVLYPEYDFVFLFDHSQGHARKRNGALSVVNRSRNCGGAQPVMRDTLIAKEDG